MLRYCVMLISSRLVTHCKTTLRWLLRRGSPLPIPNRVVKPACADGTAVMWESMSSPFFREACLKRQAFLFIRMTCSPFGLGSSPLAKLSSSRALGSFEKSCSNERGFLFLIGATCSLCHCDFAKFFKF